ncbi:MAG: flagellar biosynthetic protein FliR [Deferribacteraceae bacterium]|jgi:flagellar biosynthetic protein FliR|nr:flagellar biosynthetic protein FliR [Deferribacteraceae bacterium]
MFEQLFDQARLMTYFFVVIRTGGILFTVPVFGSTVLKPQVRMAFAIVTSAVLYPFVPAAPFGGDINAAFLILQIFKELLIGIAIGTMTSALFTGVQLGGYLIDFQMGFSMVNVMDPESGASFSYVSQVQNILLILIFIAIGGPALIIQAVSYSFTVIPTGNFEINPNAVLFAVSLFGKIFIIAMTLTAPPLIVLMATNAVMGVMARLIPQINLLVVGFPIKIGVGIIMFALSLRFIYIAFEKVAFDYFKYIREFLNMFAN